MELVASIFVQQGCKLEAGVFAAQRGIVSARVVFWCVCSVAVAVEVAAIRHQDGCSCSRAWHLREL